MSLLAALALTALVLHRRGRIVPRWLASISPALALTIAISGVGYLFLLNGAMNGDRVRMSHKCERGASIPA